jgi:uncharacterized protein YjbJ (UPF0337 family)
MQGRDVAGMQAGGPGWRDHPPPDSGGAQAPATESIKMDMDRIIGAGKQMIGSAKEAIGRLVGDAKLQVDGKAEQVAGKLQNAVGTAKDTLKRSGFQTMR